MFDGLKKVVTCFLIGWLLLACGAGPEPIPMDPAAPGPDPTPGNELPVLGSIVFVGNSLTYTNDLPALVNAEAAKRGYSLKLAVFAIPNTALEDHWNDGQVQRLLETEHWDFVVVQQGPSSQSDGRIMLEEYGMKFKELCDKNGAKLAFFMVWPAKANYHTFDGVIRNYANAAALTNSLLCPVGRDWKEYMDNTGDFSYYGPDLFHPSRKGSERAASIIYNTLFR